MKKKQFLTYEEQIAFLKDKKDYERRLYEEV